MIRSFAHKGLKQFAKTGRSGGLPVQNVNRVRRALTALNSATKPEDMDLPGFDFHELKGRRKGTYAVTITGNWRLSFQWDQGVVKVKMEDYH